MVQDQKTLQISKDALETRDALLFGTTNKKEQLSRSCYEVMVHKLCNEKCYFCSQDHDSRLKDVKPQDTDIYSRILYGQKKGYGMLGFTGGEPLIHPKILDYIKFGKKVGFRLIRVQTNGVMLGKPGFADKCVDVGVTLFKLSIHHYKPEIHDWLVRLPGAFKQIEKGIEVLRKRGARIGINVVLTEQNYREISEILLYFLDKGITTFVVIFPLYEYSMDKEGQKVGFRFSDTVPYIIKTLKTFDQLGLKRPLLLNLPLCMLPGYEGAILQTFNGTAVLNLDGSQTNIDDNKAAGKKRVPICKNCPHNKICFGVDENYLKHWGETEFLNIPKTSDFDFELGEVPVKKYFTEDELCFFEILKRKDPVNFDDIVTLKEGIQICQDCDSMNKIIATGNILEQKGLVRKKMINGKASYAKIVYDY